VIEQHVQRDTSGRLHVLHQGNSGVCRARNAGFAARSPGSRYVLFLDADDRMKPDMLDVLVQHMEAHPEVALTYCLEIHVDVKGTPIKYPGPWVRYALTRVGIRPVPDHVYATPVLALLEGQATPSTSLIRCREVEREEGFDEDLGQPGEDSDLFARIGLTNPVHRLPERLLLYRRHPDQVTRESERMKRQTKRLIKKWSQPWHTVDPLYPKRRRLWRAWNGCKIPKMWLDAAHDHLQSGNLLRPLALSGGSVLRYIHYMWILAAADRLRTP
jgi:glycosyltransferase involved in cell wall biosynthesis